MRALVGLHKMFKEFENVRCWHYTNVTAKTAPKQQQGQQTHNCLDNNVQQLNMNLRTTLLYVGL